MEYYSVLKKNEPSSHEETGQKLKCILISERNQSEKATYGLIPTIRHCGKGKAMEIVKRSVVARSWWKGRVNQQSTEDLQGSKTTPYDTIMVDTGHDTFVQTHRNAVYLSLPLSLLP